jgi:hypothetical protein
MKGASTGVSEIHKSHETYLLLSRLEDAIRIRIVFLEEDMQMFLLPPCIKE